MHKIVHERNLCIGCGACIAVCPDFWYMDEEDNKSHLKGSKKVKDNEELEIEDKDYGCNKEAADSCPVSCIHIK